MLVRLTRNLLCDKRDSGLGLRLRSRKAVLKVLPRDQRYRSGVPYSREVVDARLPRAEIDAPCSSKIASDRDRRGEKNW